MKRTDRQQYWIEEVRAFRSSGMSRAAFCRDRGYSIGSLNNWLRFFESNSTDSRHHQFAAVTVADNTRLNRMPEVCVRFPLGVEIQTNSMPSPLWVSEILLHLRNGLAPS
jgi:hypothetical protein